MYFATLPTSISGARPVGLDRYAPSEARVRGRLDPLRPSRDSQVVAFQFRVYVRGHFAHMM